MDFSFIYDVKFLAGAVIIIGYIVFFEHSGNIKKLEERIAQLESKIDSFYR